MEGPVTLEIDVSELRDRIDMLRAAAKPERVNQVMGGIFRRSEGHIRGILKKDVPRQYYAKANKEVGPAVKKARVTTGTLGAGCIIPVKGARRAIGDKHIRASGGARGWESLHKKYRVKAWIVKSGVSTLPAHMADYGGQPPFRNLSAPKLHNVVFTRKTKATRSKIVKVTGMAIPQMPPNRSEKAIQKDVRDYLAKRMDHEIQRLMGGKK